jgi:hypothetical protein
VTTLEAERTSNRAEVCLPNLRRSGIGKPKDSGDVEVVFVPFPPRCQWQKRGVCTMCTPQASDWAVHRSDWVGLRMFSGVPSVCKVWNAVRVPPRAQHDPSSEGSFALTCGH